MIIDISNKKFQDAIPVLTTIESHGYEAYFVGGCVRDSILNKEVNDIDIATSAFPSEIQEIFPKHFDVGVEHGTIVVLHQGNDYEITTFRTESTYTDFRRPDHVDFVRSLEEDTLRRDFTMNAMAIDAKGKVYDFHQGLLDIQQKSIRAVGKAEERFQEDALRMIRGIRFASQLGFDIESQTLSAIRKLAANLEKISVERVRIEMDKLLKGVYLKEMLPTIYHSGLLQYLPLADEAVYYRAIQTISHQTEHVPVKDSVMMWALLMIEMEIHHLDQIQSFLKGWTHSKQFIRKVHEFIELYFLYQTKSLTSIHLYPFNQESINRISEFLKYNSDPNSAQKIQNLYKTLPIHHRKELHINGQMIMEHLQVQKGGPWVGELLSFLEESVIKGEIENAQPVLIQLATKYYQDKINHK
ncbi:CCA tRNA nucleotidyltransferase [Facklamia sp. DSM 111018]|uniref:CCA-adding enzyme n=1 Tax=Facklamia lactis TaxID=2749967 RepID=A0ABS0LND0_9LACT|nr:CCA tRNA nucleotidyltransferase [Facklamia lactis]MBG9979848.1 CCA tRNA nucleotidyltransferase [Facklamia lactis]MBG9985472.1 CCA tRNA nucleotidyltransferase [Facklamia lactis]